MKSFIVLMLLLVVVGCSSAPKTKKVDGIIASSCFIDSVEVPPYGLLNKELEQPNVQYTTCAWSVILSIVFSETVIAPVYLIGWELYEPVGKKK